MTQHVVRKWPLALSFLAVVLLSAAVFAGVRVRSDLADLLPAGQNGTSRIMVQELQSGAASSLLLIGLDGAPEPALAALSNGLATGLRKTGLFRIVNNGQSPLDDAAMAVLFHDRYLLAPDQSAQVFSAAALRGDFTNLLQALQSSASPLVEQYGLPDPTGAFPALLQAWAGGAQLRTVDGAWFANGQGRALMLAQLASSGLDFAAEDHALRAVHDAFLAARAKRPAAAAARLLVSGPAVFAHDAASAIKSDVRFMSIASSLLVAALLFWRFRSLWVVVVIAIPVLLGAAAGALGVQLCFGFVHGITLGFGMTMLGVTVDYPVLLIGHRKRAEAAAGTLRRIGAAFNLAVLTASLGLTGMVFADFPGLSQLGVFSLAGILTAAAVTRFLLPRLIVTADLAPVSPGTAAHLQRIEKLRRLRAAVAGLAAAACVYLAVTGGPHWDGDLAHLSPISPGALALDAALRKALGAPDTGQALIVQAETAEAVLQIEEDIAPRLAALSRQGVIGGAEYAAALLPSQRTQRARQAELPDPAELAANVSRSAAGLGFAPQAFAPFEADVTAARTLAPLAPGSLPPALAGNALLSARLGALLFQREGRWVGAVIPRAVADAARLGAAFANTPGVTFVDLHAETNAIGAAYTRQAIPWLLGGALAALLGLAAGLRNTRRLLAVAGSLCAALIITLASLALAGTALSLVHLMALQFVAGIGLDYALFFSRPNLDAEERSRTWRTLVTCNGMALLTFGALCLCRAPLLRDIGQTVAIGVVSAMLCAFMFAGPRPTPGVITDLA